MGHPVNQSARSRACEDTKQSFHSVKFFWSVEVATMLIFAFIATLLTPEYADKSTTAVYPAIGTAVGAAIGVGIIFLIMLFRAPYKQRNEARGRVGELETKLHKPKPFDVECQPTTMSLPINLQKDGTWKVFAEGISPSDISLIHRGDLITVTRVAMSPEVLFNHMDGSWETTNAITVTPQLKLPAILSARGALDFEWDISNSLQWVLRGLPLTMGRDQRLHLPPMSISVQDADLVGEHFTKLDWCRVVIRLTIYTDKGSPYIPDLFIELTSSDIPNLNPRYYWEDITNESKD